MKDIVQTVREYSTKHNVSLPKACEALKVKPNTYYYHAKKAQGSVVVVDHGAASKVTRSPRHAASSGLLRAVVLVGKPSEVISVLKGLRQ